MESNEVWPGVDCNISIALENQSDRTITRGSVALVARLSALANGHSTTRWLTAAEADLKTVPNMLPLVPNMRTDCRLNFPVPALCAPSLMLANGSICWFMSVSLSWGLKTASAKIPVIVQSMCPRSLAWFPARLVLGVSEHYVGPINFSVLDPSAPIEWWTLLPSDCK